MLSVVYTQRVYATFLIWRINLAANGCETWEGRGEDEKRTLEKVQRSIVISLLSDNDIIAYRHRIYISIRKFFGWSNEYISGWK